jgi:hypothetical protein
MTNIYKIARQNHRQAAPVLVWCRKVKNHTKKNTFVMSLTF